MSLAFIAVFAGFRFLAGILFSYGEWYLAWPALALVAVSLGGVPGAIKRNRVEAYKPSGLAADARYALPWALLSALLLADALTLGAAALNPWALLVLLPVVLDCASSGAFSLFAAAIPAAIGVAQAGGAFSGGVARGPDAALLAAALVAAAGARFLGRKRHVLLRQAAIAQQERERSLANVRDAEVEIAARIQRALLLDAPGEQTGELTLEAITVASNAVDGDFYGFIPFSPTQVDILIGDVMGKGVPAALVGAALKSAFLRSSLRLIVAHPDTLPRPDELVSAVHDAVVQELMNLDSFATLQYARVDAASMCMDFVDCGHTTLLHYDSVLRVCWSVKGTDLPIGFSAENKYTGYTLPLAKGDRLLFYSDGVSEAPNEQGELFGEERLAGIMAANASLEPRELVRRILNTAMYFASEDGFKDDVTCVAVSMHTSAAEPRRVYRDFSCEEGSLAGLRSFIAGSLADADPAQVERMAGAAAEAAAAIIARIAVDRSGDGLVRNGPPAGEGESAGAALEVLEAESPSSDADLFPEPRAYRVELTQSPFWTAIRFIYRGPALPWPRGQGQTLCRTQSPDSLYVAAGGQDLRLVCLVFKHRGL